MMIKVDKRDRMRAISSFCSHLIVSSEGNPPMGEDDGEDDACSYFLWLD
jgi:hypothetical protein